MVYKSEHMIKSTHVLVFLYSLSEKKIPRSSPGHTHCSDACDYSDRYAIHCIELPVDIIYSVTD
jgi:hypothetical protein